jgi:hypothetical protein
MGRSKFTLKNWRGLDSSSKVSVINGVIQRAKEDRIILRLPAEYYVKEIDSMATRATEKDDPNGLAAPVGTIIHTIAAMEGDWDNGKANWSMRENGWGPTTSSSSGSTTRTSTHGWKKRAPAGMMQRATVFLCPHRDTEPPTR